MHEIAVSADSILKGPSRPDLLRDETLVDLFKQSVKKYPENIALIFNDSHLTYRQLDRWSDAIAADLLQKGIGRGCNVVVWWRRGLELHAAILGIVKAGATYVPVDREMPAERVEMVLAEVRADAYFSRFELNTNALIITVVPKPPDNADMPTAPGPQPGNNAYVLYTSGSTGKPKGIPITHRQICHLARAEQSYFNIRPDDKVYQGFSVSFDMWCEETWVGYLAGATLWVADDTTAKAIDELSDVFNKQKITVFHAVPSLLAVMDDNIPTLRLVNAGGEACTPQVVNKWAIKGRQFFNSYGPTETTVSATISRLSPGDAITIGKPLPNYGIAVVDEHLNVLPRGEKGELAIAGPGVSAGYLNLPELTKKKFLTKPASMAELPGDRIYLTGDAAVVNEDGSIDFFGRLDDQVKLRGYRIELGDIESQLHKQPNVTAAAGAVKQDSSGNEHLVGYVVLKDQSGQHGPDLRLELAKVLPPYMVPGVIVELKGLPRMPSGKINRSALPLPDALRQVQEDTADEAIDMNAPLESRMLAVLHKTFPGRIIDLSQDFFTDLGGHSLIAAGFVSRFRREAGVPYASLKDIYIHRPLKQLAEVWQKTPQENTAPKNTFNKIPPFRYYACWLAQTFSLFFIYGLFTVEVFTPYVGYYYTSEETESHWLGILAAVLFYCLIPPLFTLTVVAAKWLIIGKMKEGDYPLWGSYYFKWWFVKTMQRLIPSQFISGTPLYPLFLRLFGVKIAPDAQLSNTIIGAEDLVTIGRDASLSSQVVINNAFVEDGLLKLRRVTLGDHCYIGSSAVINGGAQVEEYGELQDLSCLSANNIIQPGEIWAGSPAQPKQTKKVEDLPKPLFVSSSKRTAYQFVFFIMLFIFPIFVLIPLLPVIVAIHEMDNATGDYDFSYIIYVPLLALLYMVLFTIETVLFTKLLNINIKPGRYPVHSMRYVRKWLSDQFMALNLIVMHPIYATIYIPGFFRLLGAKVGKNTEISTASSVTHPLLEIGEGAFIADAVTLGEADVRAQQLVLNKTTIQNNSFVGNSALVPQGYNLPPNMLIGVLSVPPTANQLAASDFKDWFGSPAIPLPSRQQSFPFPASLTSTPSSKRKVARATIEFLRIILPETIILCSSIFFIAYGHDLVVDKPLWKIILELPLYYLGFMGIPAILVTAALKWMLVGKYKPGQKPMWTMRVWLSEAMTSTYEALCVPFVLDYLRGTPWLPLVLRIFGTKMGKRVWMNTTDITEFDMVTIGTDAALNEDSGPQTHLFEDRVMKIGHVVIGERSSIGARTIVLYDTNIGNDVNIDALSLVMKGETLSPGTNWAGSPIKPV
jgi:non-ribosomal peptide synthetase-like protein